MVRDKKRAAKWVVVVSALSGASAANGCADRFESCAAMRSCVDPEEEGGMAGVGGSGPDGAAGSNVGGVGEAGGESGSAGAEDVPEGGDGGRGGEPDQPLLECNEDADCDDGKACTGEEVCSEGKCELGAAPCENADPDHCDVECAEGESGAVCSVSAFDEDGDGYGTVACVASPGGDCDDTPGSGGAIFPGALEVCNQNVDDDCDGLDDASDDIVLPGVAVVLVSSPAQGTTPRGQGALSRSYNPGSGFGIAWTDFRHQSGDTTSEIYFRTVGASGTLGSEERLTQATSAKDKRFPSIVPNNQGSYRVVWLYTGNAVSNDGDAGVATRTINDAALDNVSLPDLVNQPKLAASSGSDAKIIMTRDHATPSSDGFYRLDLGVSGFSPPSNKLLSAPDGEYQSFDVGAIGGDAFVVASLVGLDGVGKVSGSWSNGAPITVTSSKVSETDVVAGANLFAYRETSLEGGAARIVLRSVSSTPCSVGLADGIPVALSESALVYWDAEKKVLHARTISSAADCSVGPAALVVEQSEERVVSEPDVANDGDTVLVSWTEHETASNRWSIQGRRFSLELCQ